MLHPAPPVPVIFRLIEQFVVNPLWVSLFVTAGFSPSGSFIRISDPDIILKAVAPPPVIRPFDPWHAYCGRGDEITGWSIYRAE
jgi:hypothetical protein